MTQPSRGFHIGGTPYPAAKLAGGLYLVATPIGNLGDITLRALQTLAGADLIACEDTRVSRKLLEHYGIATPTTAYHDHNATAARPGLLKRIADGGSVALISDAGTPAISDPGFKLVREAREAGLPVIALPGASSLLTALVASGLPTDRFLFEGFLPAKATQRRSRITELSRIPASLVLFEGGSRIASTLSDLADVLGDREAAICRELTKLHEEVRRESLPVLAQHYAGDAETRGEFVIVVAPPQAAGVPQADDVDTLIRAALARVSVKDAVGEIVAATGLPRRDIYQRALELAKERDDGAP
ncbi:16S rRNA (cytidine(1402)-2'-O)-methyltransferase [Pseudorhodoplanes sp.]|uniref:16S rRNA (cytidine(1402)-2'-O)-methyltransferase n=1 Tax=Pseudorhodoplanes sp. TaxID=1934341 RepID=UPI002BD3EB41|nr:16S rRNA (cytidine(1402)-2'-O)-methyltransferase [Pseudorhodoplanes sp.]HWV51370.1 16S rRNA (cytidine(1402)-2'-O)-methyltransferase [Pseudorhodoplanes sp.]